MRTTLNLIALFLLALALRLIVWHWREYYPLGGDEQEYLAQALTFLQSWRYTELRFMRPPMYTAFLVSMIYLFDSLLQNIRFVQAVLSAITILPIYGLTRTLFGSHAGLIAALVAALSYTLAATATELLSETLFLFGLACTFWLLSLAAHVPHRLRFALLAGFSVGILVLVRSVALPLVPLGALWLVLLPRISLRSDSTADKKTAFNPAKQPLGMANCSAVLRFCSFVLAALLIITPWTIRNNMAYGGIILVDTTGAENLWLDNDPAGREAVKNQLYAMGEARLERQRLASQQGIAVITADIPRFLSKAATEATHFFALQHYDELRDKPAIWVSPPDIWARLLLGDALWLMLLCTGVVGHWLTPRTTPDFRWIAVPWLLYTLLTACIFHVELRYRLPVWPALLPYAAMLFLRFGGVINRVHSGANRAHWRLWAAAIGTILSLITLTLLHRPYHSDSLTLIAKHSALARAEAALARVSSDRIIPDRGLADRGLTDRGLQSALESATESALEALRYDDRSVLARILLARIALRMSDLPTALSQLNAAENAIAAHPHAHLLRGAILLHQGDTAAAARDLAYETGSLEDLQAWAWRIFPEILPAPTQIDLGNQLDLGHIQGFYAAEADQTRWTTKRALLRLQIPTGATAINLRLNSQRPANTPLPQLLVRIGTTTTTYPLINDWQTISVPIAGSIPTSPIIIELTTQTFRPRAYDRTSPDNRELGVRIDWIAISNQ